MPRELFVIVHRSEEPSRQRALDTWEAIGEKGRRRLLEYIHRGWSRRSRRARADLAGMQLAAPSASGFVFPPTPGPMI